MLTATEVELVETRARRDALVLELAERRLAANRGYDARPFFPPEPFAPEPVFALRPAARAAGGEWGVERVRNVLLWTGATLLALSALAFTAVAWTHLGPVGRAALLVAFTVASGVLASGLRDRLPASSGAFTGLTIALALVDWQVARRAGASGSLSAAAWWALGFAVVGLLSVGLGRVAAPAPARRSVAVLIPGSAVLTVTVIAGAAWSGALGFALIAAALTAVDRFVGSRLHDRVVRVTLRIASAAIWVVGAVLAIVAAFGPNTVGQALVPAMVMLALGVAPGLEAFGHRPTTPATQLASFLVFMSGIGATLTSVSTSVGPIGLLTLAVVLGSASTIVAPSLARPWRAAAYTAAVVAGGAGLVFAFVEAAVGELGPLAWFGHPWEGHTGTRALRVIVGPHTTETHAVGWCAVAILLIAAGATAIASVSRGGVRAPEGSRGAAIALALAAAVAAPVAAGASVLVVLVVATTAMCLALLGAALATRRAQADLSASALFAVIPALPAAGWAALTRATSVTVLAVFVVFAVGAAASSRRIALRATLAGLAALATITLASVTTLASGGSRPVAGFVGAVVAGIVLIVGSSARGDTIDGLVVESSSGAGIVTTVLLAVPSRPWIAAALTAMVPMLLLAGVRRDHNRNLLYGALAAVAALGATWMWLAAAGVTLVEAYTLPAAVLAFAAGTFVPERVRPWSWLSFGAAIVLVLAPTEGLAIVRHDDGRAIASGIAALVILIAGARRQLQAPLVLGAVALLVLGVDKIGPSAVRLPRWTMLALAGALLLWVGTTFERRREEMSRIARRLAGLR